MIINVLRYLNSRLKPQLVTILFFCSFTNISLQEVNGFVSVSGYERKAVQQTTWNEMKTLETVNSFYGRWSCSNDNYIYGTNLRYRTSVLRKRESGQSYETRGSVTAVDPGFTIEYKMFGASTPGLVFVLVKNINGYFMLKSSDGASTFTNVFAFGEGNGAGGANNSQSRILRGMLELTTELPGGGGVGTLFIGEYNVSHERIYGSVNDRVRIMKSVDNGDTWTKVTEWNTNGANQVGHIHAMKQDPYTGEIYICIGDGNTRSGIVKWNGSSSWPDNRTMTQLSAMSGFRVLTGAQRYRACDVLFDEDHFYIFTDTQTPNNTTGAESGIWRGTKNFGSYTRVDNKIFDYDPMHVGWFGEKIGDTFIFTTSREYVSPVYAWKELNTRIYTSNDGENWHASGVLNWRDWNSPETPRYINSVFTSNSRLYIDCVEGAGHPSVIQCELSKKWRSFDDPVILHPVFFVGTWNASGNDANQGFSPDAPKRTLNNILSANRICAGARVKISAGNFPEPNIYPVWSASVSPGKGSVVIEGQGMDNTHIMRSSESGSAYGINVEAARTLSGEGTPLIFKDLDFYITVDGGVNHSNYVISSADTHIRTVGCRIGNEDNDDSPLIHLAGQGAKYVSENSIHEANSRTGPFRNIVEISSSNTSAVFQNCIILNAYDAFDLKYASSSVSIKNCTFYGIERYGIVFSQSYNIQPVIENCIFSCGTAPLYDLAGLNETEINYNLYTRSNINVNGGSNSLIAGTDPLFSDPENGDFRLKSNSPCNMKGRLDVKIDYDFAYTERNNPPCIGAYENVTLIVMPSDILLGSGTGSTAEILVSSNIYWNASDNDNWFTLSLITGIGNTTVVVTSVNENTSMQSRNSEITFSAEGVIPLVVRVNQSGEIATQNPEDKKQAIHIYPNPVARFLTVEYGNDTFETVYILNSKGNVLKKDRVRPPVQQIDFSALRDGLYILEFINQKGNIKREKIIKH